MTQHELQKTLEEYINNRRNELNTRGQEIHNLITSSLIALNELKSSCGTDVIEVHSSVWQKYLMYVDGVL